jgi:hypothetical protein
MAQRIARATATVALASLAAACARERLASSERFTFASQPTGGGRISVVGENPAPPSEPRAEVNPVARVPWGGGVLPLVSPDGRWAAIEVSGSAPYATRIGDPLPAAGLDARIEAVSLQADRPGMPGTLLAGPWILGRASNAEGFLVERPYADGRRDIALARWSGGIDVLVQDSQCNAHATIAEDGTLAWSRRHPEAGEWRLVVRRGGRDTELLPEPGSDLLAPVFSGDGRGIFAVELRANAASFAWLPFGPGGVPPADAASRPDRLRSPVSARGSLSWALRATEPAAGSAASPPGSGRLMAWLPEPATMVLWLPGSMPERLASGSLAGTEIDEGNVVVTVGGALCREQLGAPPPHPVVADEPWVTRPVSGSPGELVGMLARNGQVQFARLRLRAGDDAR